MCVGTCKRFAGALSQCHGVKRGGHANVPTYAGQVATQLPILIALQHRHPRAAILLLIASLALQATRRVGRRRQLEIRRRLARVTGPALHSSGELGVGRTLGLCGDRIMKILDEILH